jgi:3-methyladenine DNA glycosylase/8-oxoguanine DNA glycosylase
MATAVGDSTNPHDAGPAGAVQIPIPPDFDFAWALRFFSTRIVPSLEDISRDGGDITYSRALWPAALGGPAPHSKTGEPVALAIRFVKPVPGADAPGAETRLIAWSAPALPPAVLRAAVTRLFDLDADLGAFRTHVASDPVLGPLVRRHPPGIRLPQLLDPFEGLLRAILGQQVSVVAATTMAERLVRLLGTPAPVIGGAPAGIRLAFPRPSDVAAAGLDRLRSIGLTRAKAATLLAAADAVHAGALDLAGLRHAPPETVHAALTALPGIGPWTASYVHLRALGNRDAFPAADLGVLKALAALGVPRAGVPAVAERWRPWRGYATLHLWQSLMSGGDS